MTNSQIPAAIVPLTVSTVVEESETFNLIECTLEVPSLFDTTLSIVISTLEIFSI